MENASENRSKMVPVRLTPTEYKTVQQAQKHTHFTKLSEYLRSLIMGKPVVLSYRDRSMDEILEELVLLRRELNAIGNNLNQAVRNINAAHGNTDSRLWLTLLETVNGKLQPSITEIKERMSQFSEIWLQKLKPAKA